MIYISTCYLGHSKTHRGPFAAVRHHRWWAKHQHPVVNECDTCGAEYEGEPSGSFQTYTARWFCSPECGAAAGW